jgi:hypothetical protein
MNKFLTSVLILIGLVLAGAGLFYVLVPEETLITKIKPTIGNFKVAGTSFGLNYSTVLVKADVTSQLVPVFVDSLHYRITVNNEILTEGSQSFEPESKNGSVQVLEIPVKISHRQLQDLVRIKAQTGAPLVADIEAYADLPLVGQKQFNFRKDIDIPLPSIPGLNLF